MPKIEVYTAICGGKDESRDDIKVFTEYDKFMSPVMNAKIFKMLPHKFLDCDISIWVDGNIALKVSKEELVDKFLGDADMALFKHPHRESIYWEIKWIEYQFRNKKDSPILKDAHNQIDHYRKIGIRSKTGMHNCGFMIRRHNRIVNQFNESWWADTCRWSSRDQLSFTVCRLAYPEMKINGITGDIRANEYLTYKSHKIPS